MNAMKKMTALLLAAAMLLGLAACGANTQQTTEATPSATEAPTNAPTEAPTQGTLPKAQAADLLEGYTARPVEDKQADDAFIKASYEWAAGLFKQVYRTETEQKTLLVSPLSVVTALAMTANGGGGNTLKEMEQVLGSGSLSMDDLNAYLHTYLNSLPSSERAKFSFANAIWFKDMETFCVKEDFLQKDTDYYDAAIRKAPFDDSTVREINQWVDQHTDGMIPKLLEQLNEGDRMILINALVFDAKWAVPFYESGEDYKQPFTGLDGKQSSASMMFGEEYSYLEDDTCTGFTKSYANDTYRFVALLPKDGKDFEGFIDGLTGEQLAALLSGAAEERTLIMVPKFSYDYEVSLPEALSAMGMRDCFDPYRADFSGISDTSLYISDVLHKTHIDLDSEGTRAAAVTAVMVAESAMPMEPPHEVYLDRPFVYMIVDTATNLPVFMGTVTGFGE
ncbi:MAG: serpin family protein [Lachnospiraceae bacterium]|nr:serpin family protein [Lachnospiraceae bacterium]